MLGRMLGWMLGWMLGCLDAWMLGCLDARMLRCSDAWMLGWMLGCLDAWMLLLWRKDSGLRTQGSDFRSDPGDGKVTSINVVSGKVGGAFSSIPSQALRTKTSSRRCNTVTASA